MGTITLYMNKFHTGELDPALEAAIDSPAYNTSCRILENYMLTVLGTLTKRPGSYYQGSTKGNKTAIFKEYKDVSGTRYMIEFTDLFCRFWAESGNLFQYGGNVLELSTPYPESVLKELNVTVERGNMYIFHKSYAPRLIKFVTDTFTITTPTFTGSRTFSATNKYPGIGMFHAGRLFVGGTNEEPTAIFASKPPVAATGATQYTDFTFGTAPDDAIFLQESDILGSTLKWFAVQKRLLCGTSRSIWMSDGNPPTPTTFDMTVQIHQGSADNQAVLVDGILVYVGRAGLSLRATAYQQEADGLIDSNIAKRSNHIIRKGVTSMAVQTLPPTTIWLSLEDGTFVSVLVDASEQVIGWTPHKMGGDGFVEYLNIQQREGNDDLYLCVRRTINGVVVRYVEIIQAINEYGSGKLEEHFVDCGFREAAGSSDVEKISPSVYSLGMDGEAGVIFHISGSTVYEFAPASTDQVVPYATYYGAPIAVPWGTAPNLFTQEDGPANTTELLTYLSNKGETGRAAQICSDLVYGGKSDWFCPSRDNLLLGIQTLVDAGKSDFLNGDWYWSSSEELKSEQWGRPGLYGAAAFVYWKTLSNATRTSQEEWDRPLKVRAARKFSQPNVPIVKSIAHGFDNNNLVTFKEVSGADVNSQTFMIKNKTDDTFELYIEDGTAPAEVLTSGTGGIVTKLLNSTTLSGLDFLEDETIDILIDGGVAAPQHVQSGEITVPIDASVIHGGISYQAKALMRKIEVPAKGTSQGKFKKVEAVIARVLESRGGSVGQTLETLQPILYAKYGGMEYGETPSRFTGDVNIPISNKIDKSGDIWIVSDDPVQFNLLGLFPRINISET